MEKHVESTYVEDGADPISVIGSQEEMGIKYSLVLQQLDSLYGPLGKKGSNFFPKSLSLHLHPWQWYLDRIRFLN